MTLITIFSTTKPFTDPFINVIQRNAIQSWIQLGPEVDVLLLGDEQGVKEVAVELNVRQLPNVERNQWGTPLVRSLFDQARQASENQFMAIVNADIILLPDFLQAVKQVASQANQFLIVGRRWGLDVDERLDFGSGWQERLRAEVKRKGMLHPIFSIDYFVFPRHQYRSMPDFVIGRPQWDNWMIYHARQENWPVIDASTSILAIHQNHDYRHLPGGQPPHGLEEGKRNRELAGGEKAKYTILDATYILEGGNFYPQRFSFERILRRFEVWLMQQNFRGLEWRLIVIVRRLRVAIGEPIPKEWVAGGLRKPSSDQDTERGFS
jgi:hypothetical protein